MSIEGILKAINAVPVSVGTGWLSSQVVQTTFSRKINDKKKYAIKICSEITNEINKITHNAPSKMEDFTNGKKIGVQVGGEVLDGVFLDLYTAYNNIFLEKGLARIQKRYEELDISTQLKILDEMAQVEILLTNYVNKLRGVSSIENSIDQILSDYFWVLQKSVESSQLSSEDIKAGEAAFDLLAVINPVLLETYTRAIEIRESGISSQEARESMVIRYRADKDLNAREAILVTDVKALLNYFQD